MDIYHSKKQTTPLKERVKHKPEHEKLHIRRIGNMPAK